MMIPEDALIDYVRRAGTSLDLEDISDEEAADLVAEGRRRSRAPITIRPIEAADREWVLRFLREGWGSEQMAVHGILLYPADHPGFLAVRQGERVGLVAYLIEANACEITLIDSGVPRAGIGTMLLDAVKEAAMRAGCARLWLVTTNDNLDALRFYQRRGFSLASLHRDAVRAARALKPEIPLIGEHGIPLRDEFELEMQLS